MAYAGWKVYDTNKSLKSTTSLATTTNNTEKTAPPNIPNGFVDYQNKDLGLRFAYPKGWGDIANGSKGIPDSQSILADTANYIFDKQQYGNQRYFDSVSKQWLNKANTPINPSSKPPKQFTSNLGNNVFVFQGNGGAYTYTSWIVIEYKGKMFQFLGPGVSEEGSTDINGNPNSYYQSQFDKDLTGFLSTFQAL